MTTLMKVTIFLTMTKNYDLTLPQYKTKCWKCSFLSSSFFFFVFNKEKWKVVRVTRGLENEKNHRNRINGGET